MFWAYDDVSNTFPTIRKPMIIIDGIQLGFEKILEKCDNGVPLTAQDRFLIDEIRKKEPDCLVYKPHTSKKILMMSSRLLAKQILCFLKRDLTSLYFGKLI